MDKDSRIGILFLHSSADLYGSDRSLLRIVSGLDANRFRPFVMLPCEGPLVGKLGERGIRVGVMSLGILRRRHANILGVLGIILANLWATLRLMRFVKEHDIRIIQSNTLAVVTGAWVSRLMRITHVWYAREIVEDPVVVKKGLAFLMLHFSSKVLAVSKAVMFHWVAVESRLSEKMEVVYNGLDCAPSACTQSAARSKLGLPADGIWVGMVGRINRVKGHGVLLEVARGLVHEQSQVRFACMGDALASEAWRKDELIGRIAQEGMRENFFLLGFRDDTDLFYQAMDIVAVPSAGPDALPTVCIEAGFFARPVVAFDVGGIGEIVQDGQTGYCVARGDIAGFRHALEHLIADAPRREKYGNQARDFCLENFSLQRQIDGLQDLYVHMLDKSH